MASGHKSTIYILILFRELKRVKESKKACQWFLFDDEKHIKGGVISGISVIHWYSNSCFLREYLPKIWRPTNYQNLLRQFKRTHLLLGIKDLDYKQLLKYKCSNIFHVNLSFAASKIPLQVKSKSTFRWIANSTIFSYTKIEWIPLDLRCDKQGN